MRFSVATETHNPTARERKLTGFRTAAPVGKDRLKPGERIDHAFVSPDETVMPSAASHPPGAQS
jgi:hypothetical protein